MNPIEYDIREECDFGMGYGEGVSENVGGREKNEEEMVVLGLNRGISITEKYLSSEARVDGDGHDKK